MFVVEEGAYFGVTLNCS